jgi:hypothetical protein
MTGTPLEQMMSQNLGLVVSDPNILALIVLCLFGGFALMQGGGFDRKVAIIVPGAILACCIDTWLFIPFAIIVGAVLFYPAIRRPFG